MCSSISRYIASAPLRLRFPQHVRFDPSRRLKRRCPVPLRLPRPRHSGGGRRSSWNKQRGDGGRFAPELSATLTVEPLVPRGVRAAQVRPWSNCSTRPLNPACASSGASTLRAAARGAENLPGDSLKRVKAPPHVCSRRSPAHRTGTVRLSDVAAFQCGPRLVDVTAVSVAAELPAGAARLSGELVQAANVGASLPDLVRA